MTKLFRVISAFAFINLMACSIDGIVSVEDPDGKVRELHPDYVKSKAGGVALYYSSVSSLRSGLSDAARVSALMTDEIQAMPAGGATPLTPSNYLSEDRRTRRFDEFGVSYFSSSSSNDAYRRLHSARIKASQARTLLSEYGDTTTIPFLANSYAIEGYAIVLLAELFCSGIPLTNIPFEGSVEYTSGYPTDSLLAIASILFDSALSFDHDSTHFRTLARVGNGRANLGLGRFEKALTVVEGVEAEDSAFRINYTGLNTPGTDRQDNMFWLHGEDTLQVENQEGGVGLSWVAEDPINQDPRIPIGYMVSNPSIVRQKKFDGSEVSVVLADWMHAKMIQSEASLNLNGFGGGEWMVFLNEARRKIGLSDTTDPGSPDDRVNLLFRERAFWFWLTGTRQGDMRRLVKHYGRSPYSVYPNGVYEQGSSTGFYGDVFVVSTPTAEKDLNYKYTGCDDYVNP